MRIQKRQLVLHKLRNIIQSSLLIVGMASIAAACSWLIFGPSGVIWAFVGVTAALLVSPSIPPGFVLSLYRARLLTASDFPQAYAVLQELARRAELPTVPRLYYVASSNINAFAVGGRKAAAIAVTDQMLRALNMRELVGVLAHEVSHIQYNDLWIMNLADTMSRVTAVLSYAGIMLLAFSLPMYLMDGSGIPWLLVLVLMCAPTLISILQLALSRAREYYADRNAAELTGDAIGLASALEKIERRQGRIWEEIFLPGRRIPEPSLLRTHPPTKERVRRLLELGEPQPTTARYPSDFVTIPSGYRLVQARPRWHRTGIWY